MRAEGEWIAVGAVARAHGVRGDMKVVLFNRSSDVLERVDAIGLRKANADEDCDIVAIVRARSAGAQWVITLEGIDDCDAVEPLRGKEICVRRAELGEVEADEFFIVDALGARVVLRDASGEELPVGRVRDVITYPSVDVLVIERDGGGDAVEIPLLDDYVERVDTGAGLVVLRKLEAIA